MARATAPRKRARRRRLKRNPFGISLGGGGGKKISYAPRSLMQTAMHGAIDAGAGVGGQALARLGRGRLNLEGNTIKGALAELLIGIGTAPLVAKFAGDDIARAYVQGVFMGPLTTAIKSRNIPIIATALGDEGELPLFAGVYDELGGAYELTPIGAGAGGGIGDTEYFAGEREYI